MMSSGNSPLLTFTLHIQLSALQKGERRKLGTSYIAPVKRKNPKILSFVKTALKTRPDFANTSPTESYYGFAFNSTILSPMTNSESQPFDKLRVNSIIIRYATHG